jgi:putative addiction module component (TIGR02574 family)
MSSIMKALGIDRLSVPERIILVQEIWDSIWEDFHDLILASSREEEPRESLGSIKKRLATEKRAADR